MISMPRVPSTLKIIFMSEVFANATRRFQEIQRVITKLRSLRETESDAKSCRKAFAFL
jgi:hypothetical protein